ncbi:MAG: aminotransferase class IV [Phenylobacterium sp.]|uniref:aminotransferase class IV n=1 Tax=Phenylobacterium sp. TaxID=1871053 RepID=UPI0025FE259D|nr:aminotransferase class IV [Phenylobacterium sp.]MCG9916422.1 aminotransferase class IV [Phenylobacterium sp.]
MSIPLDDRGLLLGDGLFETLWVRDGVPADWAEHMDRMALGCTALGLPAPDPDTAWTSAQDALRQAGLLSGSAALRMTWTAGSGGRGLDRPAEAIPRLFATAAPMTPSLGPLHVITARVRRNASSLTSRHKTLSYLDNVLARREARLAGADEALILNTDGHVACASAANLFWLSQGRLLTPALDCGVLAGVTRAQVLQRALEGGLETAEVKLGPDALAGAEAIFLTNSLMGVRPVWSLDGRRLDPAAVPTWLAPPRA